MAGVESTTQPIGRKSKTKAAAERTSATRAVPEATEQPPVSAPGLGEVPALQAQMVNGGTGDDERASAQLDDQDAMVLGTENLDMPLAQGYSDAEWHALVSQAAYRRAEQRGFQNGTPEQDWLEAEEELRRQMGAAR
jgi:hypothetical protein